MSAASFCNSARHICDLLSNEYRETGQGCRFKAEAHTDAFGYDQGRSIISFRIAAQRDK
jgi:hypothetical protein